MKNRAFVISIVTLVVGAIALIGGSIFLTFRLLEQGRAEDAVKIVEVGAWQNSAAPEVIWTFTEIGKGQLTTNNHENDYDFIWAIEGDKLKIETDWLTTLNDEYTYKLDTAGKTLTIETDSGNIDFRPLSDVNP
ncbi:hypothetical protein IKF57_01175 [Candidatus Saccharibacteria bacterium]|nr:hypothetical protein [Candidatus Saccharibacteria bacterium]